RECSRIENVNKYDDLAYIIYTSGTTGMPKGVEVLQRNVVRLVINTNYITISEQDRILQTGSIAFDASTFEIWGALLNGATLYLTTKDVIMNADLLNDYLNENEISILWLTASLFSKLVNENDKLFQKVKYLLTGGDIVSSKHVKMVKDRVPDIHIINGYGPTENTTFSTCYEIKNITDNLPIGRPIANSTAFIFDQNKKLVPIGVPGELYVGGDGLSKGYLNNQELTKTKFVQNPYYRDEIIYKTGDLARWLPDKNIEFLGRIDHQVKIRGFRVELDEIVNRISEIEGIRDCVVIVVGQDNKLLCAYYVSDREFTSSDLRKILNRNLPDYMIPSFFVRLDEMPLNTNGKVDREALLEIDHNMEMSEDYQAPRNDIEEKVSAIFAGILGLNEISITDDFFELGGHSLSATTVIGRIHKELNVYVPIAEFFRLRNVESVSEYISFTKKEDFVSISPVNEAEYYDVSSAQQRMYILQQMDKTSISYNIPMAVEIKGRIDLKRVQKAFEILIERHEALRTSFHSVDNQIVQKIHSIDEVTSSMDIVDFMDQKDNECIKSEIKNLIRPFDLEKFPLLRLKLLRREEDRYILVLDIHHIISDGTSMSILIKEFSEIYSDRQLPKLRLQYKDYAFWQKKIRELDAFKQQEKYWLKEFSGHLPVLDLISPDLRRNHMTFAGDYVVFALDSEVTEKVIAQANETENTLFMVLLANIILLLSKYSGQKDIIIGTPSAGRNHSDLENIMGMFVNTLAIRGKVDESLSFKDYLNTIKGKTLKAFSNQDYQFEELVDHIGLRRSLKRNPLFDIMFVLQNFEESRLKLDDASISPYDVSEYDGVTKFDMTIEAYKNDNEISFTIRYLSELFDRQTVIRITKLLQDLIRFTSGEGRDTKLCDIELMTEEEKDALQEEMNLYGMDELSFFE
ncbi:MAG: amino acid adenylation domain-containing protein, partial [Ruminiclostridium sp.]